MHYSDQSVPLMTDLALIVKTARDSGRAHRRMYASGNGHGATLHAMERHAATIRAAHERLTELGRRDLSAALQDETDTLDRLEEARKNGQERPELQDRLKSARYALLHPNQIIVRR